MLGHSLVHFEGQHMVSQDDRSLMFITCSIYVRVSPVSDLLTTLVCGGWDVYYHVAPCCSRNTLWETYGEPMG